ncbi:MAG: hypothetical protein ACK4I8_06210 [Armatimonadota bacterium]
MRRSAARESSPPSATVFSFGFRRLRRAALRKAAIQRAALRLTIQLQQLSTPIS